MTDVKKGTDWLADKLKAGDRGDWCETTTTRFSFRHETPRLVQPRQELTHAEILFGDLKDARNQLHASLAVDVLSIRLRARDMKRKGKLVETWLRGSFIRRIIERPKPTREGVSHDRYSVLLAFLLRQGLVESDNHNGYRWKTEYKHLPARAAWLVDLIRREGELRHVAAASRYMLID
jgi:hypothetical protein